MIVLTFFELIFIKTNVCFCLLQLCQLKIKPCKLHKKHSVPTIHEKNKKNKY